MAGVQLGQDFYALATHLGKAADARLRAFQAGLADHGRVSRAGARYRP